MKAELTDVSETQKTLTIEIPSEVVAAEIDKIARDYSRQARLPGFRPGKVPASIAKQRFRDQILHDVSHALIPRAVEEALQARGIEPVDSPNIKAIALKEGEPLTFTADVETLPPFDPGDLSTIALTKTSTTVTDDALEQTLQQLRQRGATLEPVEGRPIADGDTVVLDIERQDADGGSDRHENISLELGGPANPPGFDANLVGLNSGDQKTFTIHFPEDYAVKEMANTDVTYSVVVKDVRKRVLPELDDEFAKDLGEFDSLQALRDRVRGDMQAEADEQTQQQLRADLLKQLSERLGFDVPTSMVEREIDRRLEEFVRQLMQQQVDPRKAGIDWAQMRESQREPARAAVASALVLDEIARREQVTVADEDLDKEIEKFALQAGRTPAALRAQLEKEGGVARLTTGLRREKAVALALSKAQVAAD